MAYLLHTWDMGWHGDDGARGDRQTCLISDEQIMYDDDSMASCVREKQPDELLLLVETWHRMASHTSLLSTHLRRQGCIHCSRTCLGHGYIGEPANICDYR